MQHKITHNVVPGCRNSTMLLIEEEKNIIGQTRQMNTVEENICVLYAETAINMV